MTEPTSPKPNLTVPIVTLAVCGVMLVIHLALSLTAVVGKSVTYDEHINSVGGYMARFMNDYRIDVEDGALCNMWGTINQSRSSLTIDLKEPLLSNDSHPGNLKGIYGDHDEQWYASVKILYGTPMFEKADPKAVKNDGQKYVNRSRQMYGLLSALGGGLLAFFAYRLSGAMAAVIVTALYAFDPNFLAHGPLVKSDVPLAVCVIGILTALWFVGRRATILNLSLLALAMAASLNVKYSGILFVLAVALALILRAIHSAAWVFIGRSLETRISRFIAVGVTLLAIGIFSYAFLWMCYGFRYSPDGQGKFTFDKFAQKYKRNVLIAEKVIEFQKAAGTDSIKLNAIELDAQLAVAKMSDDEVSKRPDTLVMKTLTAIDNKHLLPNAWTTGLFFTYATTNMRGGFLMGQYSVLGWWYYFPMAMLFKTPTATIVAAVVALIAWFVVRFRVGRNVAWPRVDLWTLIVLLLPIGLYCLSAVTTKLNIGLRHMLPVYPVIFLGIALAFARLLEWIPRFAGSALLLLGSGLVMECCITYPNYLAFFNAPSGGFEGGVRLLSDSSIDWGQDLPLLAEWQKKHDNLPLYISYFGLADPSHYGLYVQHLPGSWPFAQATMPPQTQPAVLAISVTNLQGTYMSPELRRFYSEFLTKLDRRNEIHGGSIYLYDWPPKK